MSWNSSFFTLTPSCNMECIWVRPATYSSNPNPNFSVFSLEDNRDREREGKGCTKVGYVWQEGWQQQQQWAHVSSSHFGLTSSSSPHGHNEFYSEEWGVRSFRSIAVRGTLSSQWRSQAEWIKKEKGTYWPRHSAVCFGSRAMSTGMTTHISARPHWWC